MDSRTVAAPAAKAGVAPVPGAVQLPDATRTEVGRLAQSLLEEALCEGSFGRLLVDLDVEALAPLFAFAPQGYTRRVLASTSEAEILLMGWLPGQESTVHDHGDGWGLVRVLVGTAREDRFRERANGELQVMTTRAIPTGAILEECPGDIHRVAVPSRHVLVTLHVYAPRLNGCRSFVV
ncbi:MAG TPA: cysteine dioxygenase family protein [Candidatus Thermoplasmatota archaeon]|nr:cysteine dioxygenase family protein [Candidatus Thermoplasmatota archaeon]